MLERILEPEVMDTWEDAVEYDAMDHGEVNNAFAQRALELGSPSGLVLDVGTGTARIPILLAAQNPNLRIIGIDLSANMLKLGESNVSDAGLSGSILLRLLDAKQLPYLDNQFDMVISNSLIHHLPDPMPFLKEVNRIIKPNAGILIRDLIRPNKIADLEVSSVKKKLKDKGFARNVNRDDITQGCAELGVPLDEHIQFVINAMKSISGELGL